MGYNPSAFACLGVELTHGDLFKTERRKAFDHDHPRHWKVDPTTGRDLWREVDICILDEQAEDFPYDWSHGRITCQVDEQGERYIVGVIVEDRTWGGPDGLSPVRDDDIPTLRAKLRELLEPHGLWNEDGFGLLAMLS